MRQIMGLILIAASIWLIVYGFVWFSNFLLQPELFPLYQMLVELPEAERTISGPAGDLVLPIGIFKISGLILAIFLLFVGLSLIKMFFNAGITLLAPKVEDSLDKLVKKLKSTDSTRSTNS